MPALLMSVCFWFIILMPFIFPLRNFQLPKKEKRFCFFDLCLRLALYLESGEARQKLVRCPLESRGSHLEEVAKMAKHSEIFTKQHSSDSEMVSHLVPIFLLRISFNEPLLLKECVIFLMCVGAEIRVVAVEKVNWQSLCLCLSRSCPNFSYSSRLPAATSCRKSSWISFQPFPLGNNFPLL